MSTPAAVATRWERLASARALDPYGTRPRAYVVDRRSAAAAALACRRCRLGCTRCSPPLAARGASSPPGCAVPRRTPDPGLIMAASPVLHLRDHRLLPCHGAAPDVGQDRRGRRHLAGRQRADPGARSRRGAHHLLRARGHREPGDRLRDHRCGEAVRAERGAPPGRRRPLGGARGERGPPRPAARAGPRGGRPRRASAHGARDPRHGRAGRWRAWSRSSRRLGRAGHRHDARRHLDSAAPLARDSLAEVRRSVQALRPAALDGATLPDGPRTSRSAGRRRERGRGAT